MVKRKYKKGDILVRKPNASILEPKIIKLESVRAKGVTVKVLEGSDCYDKNELVWMNEGDLDRLFKPIIGKLAKVLYE